MRLIAELTMLETDEKFTQVFSTSNRFLGRIGTYTYDGPDCKAQIVIRVGANGERPSETFNDCEWMLKNIRHLGVIKP